MCKVPDGERGALKVRKGEKEHVHPPPGGGLGPRGSFLRASRAEDVEGLRGSSAGAGTSRPRRERVSGSENRTVPAEETIARTRSSTGYGTSVRSTRAGSWSFFDRDHRGSITFFPSSLLDRGGVPLRFEPVPSPAGGQEGSVPLDGRPRRGARAPPPPHLHPGRETPTSVSIRMVIPSTPVLDHNRSWFRCGYRIRFSRRGGDGCGRFRHRHSIARSRRLRRALAHRDVAMSILRTLVEASRGRGGPCTSLVGAITGSGWPHAAKACVHSPMSTSAMALQEAMAEEPKVPEVLGEAAAPLPAPFASVPMVRREESGSRHAERLRRRGLLPGVVYGGGKEGNEINVAVHPKAVKQLMGKDGTPGMLGSKVLALHWCEKEEDLQPGGIQEPSAGTGQEWVLIRDVHENPMNEKMENVSFLRVKKGTPVRAFIPLRVNGETQSPGIKRGGFLEVMHPTVEVFCAPEDIPECFELQVGHLEGKKCIRYSDLKTPERVRVMVKDETQPVVRIGGKVRRT